MVGCRSLWLKLAVKSITETPESRNRFDSWSILKGGKSVDLNSCRLGIKYGQNKRT